MTASASPIRSRPVRVLCVDDHAFLVEGLRSRFEREASIEFVGRLDSAADLVPEVERLRPDVVLLDIEMPGPDVFETLGELHRACPETRAIMLSAFVRDRYIDTAVKAGAWGYLSKSDEPDAVVAAIRTVAGGDFAFSPAVAERLRGGGLRSGADAEVARCSCSRLDSLTPRELEILRLIGRGLSRADIAKSIFRSPKTVDAHRISIMDKLDIHDRVELARFAIREGLVEP